MNTMASILGRRMVTRGLAQVLALTAAGCLLVACGQKGPLYMPDSGATLPAPVAPGDELAPSEPPIPMR